MFLIIIIVQICVRFNQYRINKHFNNSYRQRILAHTREQQAERAEAESNELTERYNPPEYRECVNTGYEHDEDKSEAVKPPSYEYFMSGDFKELSVPLNEVYGKEVDIINKLKERAALDQRGTCNAVTPEQPEASSMVVIKAEVSHCVDMPEDNVSGASSMPGIPVSGDQINSETSCSLPTEMENITITMPAERSTASSEA